MADEQWITESIAKWLAGAILTMGIWVGAIEQRLRQKANTSDVAKNPVEADTVTTALNEVNSSLEAITKGQDRNAEKLVKLGEDVATLMERTKE